MWAQQRANSSIPCAVLLSEERTTTRYHGYLVTGRAGKGSSVINALIALDKLLLYRQVLLRVLLESTRMLERTRKLLISLKLLTEFNSVFMNISC